MRLRGLCGTMWHEAEGWAPIVGHEDEGVKNCG